MSPTAHAPTASAPNAHAPNAASALPAKPHFAHLDGLRGVAAVVVVAFHIFEAHATSHADQIINHGYLAVDFFFMLSGFVIGYAYDDRWKRLSGREFAMRRLIRLQPMVVLGTLIGALLFYAGAGEVSPRVGQTPPWELLLATLMGCLMLPMGVAQEVRGWQETYPLNGPAWSLFYEYIANALYALLLRRLPTWALTIVVLAAALATGQYLLTAPGGDIVGGWALTGHEIRVGLTRLAFPFTAGLLLARLRPTLRLPRPFLTCSILLVALLAAPRIGGPDVRLNACYELACIIVGFPLIIMIGASTLHTSNHEEGVACRLLGRISYPLYITHYPLIYLYFAYVHGQAAVTPTAAAAWGAVLWAGAVTLAYAYARWYDEPVRQWLTRRYQRARERRTLTH